ncbi:MAG: hypothetical protein RL660_1031 [Bacteroidota bacterium]
MKSTLILSAKYLWPKRRFIAIATENSSLAQDRTGIKSLGNFYSIH